MDSTLSGTTTLGQSGPRSDGNEGVLDILQISSIIGALALDCLVSYTRIHIGGSYPSSELQWGYSTAPADWVALVLK